MSRRINNVIAFGIVAAFWLIFVLPIMANDPIITESTSTVTTNGNQKTEVISPPPSAISPQFGSGNNNDLCTISSSGSVQTQILGLSVGTTYTEENCLRLKKAQKLYVFGMKVAAVSVMCQDPDVWSAMMDAGTPCPIDGMIGEQAKNEWDKPINQERRPDARNSGGINVDPDTRTTLIGSAVVVGILALLLGG